MKWSYFLPFALLTVLPLTGCLNRNKPNPAIAGEVEENFKSRWIAKRMSELQAGGVTDPREARQLAAEEFKKRYEYTSAAQKADPLARPSQP